MSDEMIVTYLDIITLLRHLDYDIHLSMFFVFLLISIM